MPSLPASPEVVPVTSHGPVQTGAATCAALLDQHFQFAVSKFCEPRQISRRSLQVQCPPQRPARPMDRIVVSLDCACIGSRPIQSVQRQFISPALKHLINLRQIRKKCKKTEPTTVRSALCFINYDCLNCRSRPPLPLQSDATLQRCGCGHPDWLQRHARPCRRPRRKCIPSYQDSARH